MSSWLAAVGRGSGLDDLKTPTLTAQVVAVPLFLRVGWRTLALRQELTAVNGCALALQRR